MGRKASECNIISALSYLMCEPGVPAFSFCVRFSREEGMPLQRGCSEISLGNVKLESASVCDSHADSYQPYGASSEHLTVLYSHLLGCWFWLSKTPA